MCKVNLIKLAGLMSVVLACSLFYGCSQSSDKTPSANRPPETGKALDVKESFERRTKIFIDKIAQYTSEVYKAGSVDEIAAGGGLYIKQKYVVFDIKYDIEQTTSIVNPYVARLEFMAIQVCTKRHTSEAEAERDNEFEKLDADNFDVSGRIIQAYRHKYGWDGGASGWCCLRNCVTQDSHRG